jgi:hypothetical protein
MSKRKPKPIDEQGHDPAPGVVPSRIDCRRCCDCRIKDHDWKRPCPPSASGRETRVHLAERPPLLVRRSSPQ